MEWSRRRLLLSALAGGLAASGVGARRHPLSGEAASTDRLTWFEEARFGLFVHWGPYSIAGVEASWPIMVPELAQLIGPDQKISEADYLALAERFDPRGFDPRAWVRFLREAGMRYLVVTAKHHDGYCLFDAPGTDYKITRSPYGRDLLAELAEACAEDDLPLGFYYSPPDMHHPGYRDTSRPVRENWFGEPERPQWAEYLDTMEAQLRQLLTGYGEVAVVWFDGLFEHDKYQPARFHRIVRELSPRTLVNDRLGADLGDYVTPEQAVPEGIPVKRDGVAPEITVEAFRQFVSLLTSGLPPEQSAALFATAQRARFPTEPLPSPERFQPWESCMTLGVSWAFDPLERELKSADAVIHTLVEVASRGGNLLLNVGPTPAGTFPESARERLRAVGRWLGDHGESIHGTTYGPVQGVDGLRSTIRDNRLYLHLLERPEPVLSLPEAAASPRSARRLPQGPRLEIEGSGRRLRLPPAVDGAGVEVLELELDAPPELRSGGAG